MHWPAVGAFAVNVIDDFNRQSVHIAVEPSINSARLVRVFEQIKRDHGLPKVIRTDNGSFWVRHSNSGARTMEWT